MIIRRLEEADIEQYWALRLRSLKEHPEAFGSSYEEYIKRENPLESVRKNFSNPDNYTFGAFERDELIGMVTLVQNAPLKLKHRADIFAMYVKKEHGGKGVGTALVEAAITQARAIEEVEQINLAVVTTNESANKLYRKLGFTVFGTEKHALKVGNEYYDEHHMVLFL